MFTQPFIQAQINENIRVTGLRAGNSPVIGEFPAQMACNAENVSICWRHHGRGYLKQMWLHLWPNRTERLSKIKCAICKILYGIDDSII